MWFMHGPWAQLLWPPVGFVPEDYFLVAFPGKSVKQRVCTLKTLGWGRKLSREKVRALSRGNLGLDHPQMRRKPVRGKTAETCSSVLTAAGELRVQSQCCTGLLVFMYRLQRILRQGPCRFRGRGHNFGTGWCGLVSSTHSVSLYGPQRRNLTEILHGCAGPFTLSVPLSARCRDDEAHCTWNGKTRSYSL